MKSLHNFYIIIDMASIAIEDQIQTPKTKAKKLSVELQSRKELLDYWLETSTDGLWDWDLANNEEYLSPRFKELLGYEDHELVNHPSTWQKLIFPEDLDFAFKTFDEHLKYGKPFCIPVRYRHKNGSTVHVICRGQAIKDENGNYVRMVGCHQDITELKFAEEEIKRNKETLDEKNKELVQKNAALKEILSQIEIDRNQYKKEISANIEKIILPIIHKLKRKSTKLDLKYITALENSITDINSQFGSKISQPSFYLSNREIEICTLIKSDLGTKEIAKMLNLSTGTIEAHRNRIRKKLKLVNSQVPLKNFLQTLDL